MRIQNSNSNSDNSDSDSDNSNSRNSSRSYIINIDNINEDNNNNNNNNNNSHIINISQSNEGNDNDNNNSHIINISQNNEDNDNDNNNSHIINISKTNENNDDKENNNNNNNNKNSRDFIIDFGDDYTAVNPPPIQQPGPYVIINIDQDEPLNNNNANSNENLDIYGSGDLPIVKTSPTTVRETNQDDDQRSDNGRGSQDKKSDKDEENSLKESWYEPEDEKRPYEGYRPKLAADFMQSQPYLQTPPISPVKTIPSSLPRPAEKRTTHRPAIVMGILCALGFVLCLALGLSSASCSMKLCDKFDLSTVSDSGYMFRPFQITAPLSVVLLTLSVAFLSGAVLCFIVRLNCTASASYIPEKPLSLFGAHIRNEAMSYSKASIYLICGNAIPIFIIIGSIVKWRTASAFIMGLIPGLCGALLNLSVSTRAATRTACAANKSEKSILSAFTIAARGATIAPLVSHSFSFGMLTICYLIVRDVNALVGFIFGSAFIAFVLRVLAATYGTQPPASHVTCFHRDDARHPFSPGPSVAVHAAATGAHVAEVAVLFAAPIVATAVLGTTMPYFQDNAYAMCVFNHLAIDHSCMMYTDGGGKRSFAVSLCRQDSFISRYPNLGVTESNSVFIILPFLLGVTVLVPMMTTALLFLRRPRDPQGRVSGEERATMTRKFLKPFMKNFAIHQGIRIVLTTVMYIIVMQLVLGSRSPFGRANSANMERYELPTTRTSESISARDLCRAQSAPNSGLPSDVYPRLNIVLDGYRPVDLFGRRLPSANRIAWNAFGCVELGLLCGTLLCIWCAYASTAQSESAHYARSLAADEIDGEVTLSSGIGALGSAIAAGIVILTALCCYGLLQGYGIGLGAIGFITTLGPASMLENFEQIIRDARRQCVAIGLSAKTRRRIALLTMIGEFVGGIGSAASTGSAGMGALVLGWALILHSGIVPSAMEVAGRTSASSPTRHITDMLQVDLLQINVLSSVVLGMIIPIAVCSAVAVAGASATEVMAIAIRREMVKRGPWERAGEGPFSGACHVAKHAAIHGATSPMTFSILIALGGFWFGNRQWIGLVMGCIATGVMVAFFTGIVGKRMHGVTVMMRVKADIENGDIDNKEQRKTSTCGTGYDVGNRRTRMKDIKKYGKGNDGKQKKLDLEGEKWKWDQVSEEWISGCIRVLIVMVAGGAVVSKQVSNTVSADRWWLVIVMTIVWLALVALGQYMLSRFVMQIEKDAVFKVEEMTSRVNMNGASDFVEAGPSVLIDSMSAHNTLLQTDNAMRTNINDFKSILV